MRLPRPIALCAILLVATSATATAQRLSRAAAVADLDSLRFVLQRYSSYRLVNGYAYERHLDSLTRQISDSISIQDFWRAVQTLVGRLQDAHSNVVLPQGVPVTAVGGTLPFALTMIDSAIIALAPCRCSLLAPGFPRIVSIDGVAVDSLTRIAGLRFAGHSPQRFRYRALGALRPIEAVLQLAGRQVDGTVSVRLTGSRGDTTFAIATDRSGPAPPPSFAVTAELRGPIAVLRIPLMFARGDSVDDVGYQMVRAAIESETFRRAPALIIDVRGNDGGTRDILDLLLPRFIREPLAYNVVLVRADTNGLGERSLLSPDDVSLPQITRDALRSAIASFKPVWQFPPGDFLPQRFGAVILPAESSQNMSDKPVVVLMDAGSFSATDSFLGAMSLAPNVTLMGTPSAGGSGRSRQFVLPRSRLRVILSTMASFRPNGQLYDGVGVAPDIHVPPTVEGLAAGQDTQLAEALRYLTQKITARP